MSAFDQTLWADSGFAQAYLDQADHCIPERHYLFRVVRSFYRSFVAGRDHLQVCDMGCGDGILAEQLLQENASLAVTLVDGSADMLAAARKRLAGRPNVSFVQKSFEDLARDSSGLPAFDFVTSSFAIHHLTAPERQALFTVVFQRLKAGGHFLNLDVGLPAQPAFTEWQYALWQEWIDARSKRLGLNDAFHDVPSKARANPDNKYSPLVDQLAALATAGFGEVECHYKNGIFAIYSGQRA